MESDRKKGRQSPLENDLKVLFHAGKWKCHRMTLKISFFFQEKRPTIPRRWENNGPTLAKMSRIMKESWHSKPESRLPILQIKKQLNNLSQSKSQNFTSDPSELKNITDFTNNSTSTVSTHNYPRKYAGINQHHGGSSTIPLRIHHLNTS